MGNKKWIRQVVFPILTAMIWGTAFVFQSIGTESLGPFTFCAVRSVIATVALSVVLLIRRRAYCVKGWEVPAESVLGPDRKGKLPLLLLGGGVCGAALTLALNFQQAGLSETSPGKAAFITSLYIVLVPLAGLFTHRKLSSMTWIGVSVAVLGLYFLCIREGKISITTGDFMMLISAFCFAAHILLVDRFSAHLDGIELSCIQFVFVSVLSGIAMLIFEHPTWQAVVTCFWPLFYVGVFSSSVAYTLQILAQKGSNPTVVSLFLSTESLFATLATALLLHELPSSREMIGCVFLLAAMVLAQMPDRREHVKSVSSASVGPAAGK